MQLLELIDRLDNYVYDAKAVPFTDTVRVDRGPLYEILDQIRVVVPDEIRRAQEILAKGGTLASRPSEDDGGELRRIAATLESLQQAQRPTPPPLTAAASDQVRAIVETAERAAADISAEAEAEAERIVAEAQAIRDEAARDEAAGASERLRRMEKAANELSAAAASAETRFEDLLDKLRGPADALAEVLSSGAESLEGEVSALRTQVGGITTPKPLFAETEAAAKEEASSVEADLPGPNDNVAAARISIIEPAAVVAAVVDLDTQEHDSLLADAAEDADADDVDADDLWMEGD